MSVIKFGDSNLLDWDYFSEIDRILLRNIEHGITLVSITDESRINVWSVWFYGEFGYLRDLFGDDKIIGTEEEAKKRVDDFLVRASKLTVFI